MLLPCVSFTFSISIHSLRVEGDFSYKGKSHVDGISIHSLRVEGDVQRKTLLCSGGVFQSTPSVWRETYKILRLR